MSRIEKALEKAAMLRNIMQAGDIAQVPYDQACGMPGKGADGIGNPCITTLNDPDSPVTEEYRKLKSLVLRLTKKNGFRNALMVTSSLSAEGKSVTSLNLAVSLAHDYSHTVLLIDADLRRPSLHRYLGVTPHGGLADYLTGGVELSDVLIKTPVPKLSLLASGKKVANPAELLSSEKMHQLLDEIKYRYPDRYVIIDTPPVLPFAETHTISSWVDGILFVVKAGLTSLENVKEAIGILEDARMLGIVYNSVGRENLNGRYDRYYYGAYGEETKRAVGKNHVRKIFSADGKTV